MDRTAKDLFPAPDPVPGGLSGWQESFAGSGAGKIVRCVSAVYPESEIQRTDPEATAT